MDRTDINVIYIKYYEIRSDEVIFGKGQFNIFASDKWSFFYMCN